MKLAKHIHIFWLLITGIWACSPKVSPELKEARSEAVVKDTTVTVKVDSLSDCKKFSDADNEDKAIENYVLYRDFFKLNKFDEAYKYWEETYEMAPAADGKRYNVFTDGVYILQYKLSQTRDSSLIYDYIDRILTLYDEAIECYPKYDGFLTGRKAFDVFYKYPNSYTKQQQYVMFKHAFDTQKEKPVFIFNPLTSLLMNQFLEGNIDTAEARTMSFQLREEINKGIASGEQKESWDIVKNYSLEKLDNFESIRYFYDCDYYRKKYLDPYLSNAENYDCDEVAKIYSKLRWGGCSREDKDLMAIEQRLKEDCELIPGGASTLAKEAYEAYKNGEYSKAIEGFEEAIKYTKDTDRKARYAMMIANLQFVHLKNYPAARKAALEAAKYRENWGDPYMLIGNLYASSGPLCGPGTGWDSQIVTWAAIDKWEYAKKIDPSVSAKAQKLIDQYWQYMPTNEDIAKRTLKAGERFKVPCWIQEWTKIRASRAY